MSRGGIRVVGRLPIDTTENIKIAFQLNWLLSVSHSLPSCLIESRSRDDTNRLRCCGNRLLRYDGIRQRAGLGLASVAGAEGGWRGGQQEAAGSVESVREHSLVGEVAWMGDEFAGGLRQPSVRHFGTQP